MDLNKFPPLDWAKVDQNLKMEGMFMYGGQTSNGEASSDLWVLRSLKKGLNWVRGDKICEGKGPGPRFDHAMCRLRENLVILGGRNRFQFVSSVYLLDIERLVWSQIAVHSHAEP